MSLTFLPGNYNIALNGAYDKYGDAVLNLKRVLTTSSNGRWRVMGSGSGAGGLVQLRGQTAGVGGAQPYDVLVGAAAGTAVDWVTGATTNSISNARAWLIMEELDGTGAVTGRAFCLKRYHQTGNVGFGGAWHGQFTTNGYATSGATATSPPAAVTSGQSFYMWSSASLADGGANNWITQDASTGGTAAAFASMHSGTTNQNWCHVAIETSPGTDNVCGFQLTTYSRTQGCSGLCLYYRPLDRYPVGMTGPFVIGGGNWGQCFGQVGNGTNIGPFWVGSGQVRCGLTLEAASFVRRGAAGLNSGLAVPGTVYLSLRSDSTLLDMPVEVMTSSGQVALLKNCYVNTFNRDYPTSYDVAGAQPRHTFGQIIMHGPAAALNASP
jgi:hypothetical protein